MRTIAVLLSSFFLVNKVLLAKTKQTRFCTDDLDRPFSAWLGGPSRVEECKIFITEALPEEKYEIFCNLRSAAKGFGIKYSVLHRGGRFMARMRSEDRVPVFESLSDLQAIQSALGNKILQPFACHVPRACDVDEPCSTVLGDQ